MSRVGDAVAIVGTGCRYPDAAAPEQLWELALSQRRAFRRMPSERLNLDDYHAEAPGAPDTTYLRFAAVLDGWSFDRARYRVPGPTYRVTDLTHWLALDVAADTLEAAGFPEGHGLDRERAGVVLGNSMGGEFTRAAQLRLRWPFVRRTLQDTLSGMGWAGEETARLLTEVERRYKEPFPVPSDDSLVGGLANAIAGRVCNHFDLLGGGYTVDGACSSSLLAVTSACTALLDGDLDFVLAGGVDLSLDPFETVGFARLGALASSEMRVYDARPTGFFPGEGCGMVALMRADDAIALGRTPLALIRGWGVSSDGRGGLTRPETAGQKVALRRAYARAGFGPETVTLFEGHGTGTAVGDEAELGTLIEAQGGRRGVEPPAALGSIKANIGHTKAAAGVAGLIKITMALQRQVIPPTTGCVEPHEALQAPGVPLRIVREATAWPDAPLRAAVSAMGFGGINTHVVLEATAPRRSGRLTAAERRVARAPLDCEVFAFAAGGAAELRTVLDRVADRAETMSRAELTDLAASLADDGSGRSALRVAIVARDPAQLARRAREAGGLIGDLRDRTLVTAPGVYAGGGGPGRVGLLFPGQGAPVYGGPGALGTVLPEAADAFAGTPAGTVDTAMAQPAIHRASVAGLRWLDRLGAEAVAAVGHSLGEITALAWAGVLDEGDALDLVTARGRIMGKAGRPDTGMASIAASPAEVVDLLKDTDLVIAADNAVAQVVAGSLADIAVVLDRARAAGITAQRLKVSHAFHSAAVAAAEPLLADHLAGVPLAPISRRVYSTINGRALTAAHDLRRMLAQQVTGPVLFREALNALVADCDLLVEAGPGRSLTSMAAPVAGVPVIPLDVGAESAVPLCEVAAALFAAGAVADLTALFAERFHRPFDLWREPEFIANPCESAPSVAPVTVPAPETDAETDAADAVPSVATDEVGHAVRSLVAEALELPAAAIADDELLLGDLHLNSLRVVQLVARIADATGRTVPAVPPSFATATVADLIAQIDELPVAESDAGPPAGVADWHRVLVPETEPVRLIGEPARHHWRLFGDAPLRAAVEAGLDDVPDAPPATVVFLPEDPDDPAVATLVEAARKALAADMPLTVVDLGDTASGFLASVAQEHPDRPIRRLRVMTADAADAVVRVLAAPWRGYAETLIDETGRTCAVAHRPVPVRDAPDAAPLAAGDVLLVTGGGKGIGFESAAFLADRWGVRLGLLGRADPAEDAELGAGLDRLEKAGAVFRYVRADVTDPASVRRAVARITEELGPVAGVIHSSGVNRPARFTDLRPEEFAEHAAPKHHGLRAVLDTLDPGGLRLLLTFGSVIGRFGLPGEAHYALANGRMRESMRLLARGLPGCRVQNVDWTVWSGAGMGERLDVLENLGRSGVVPLPAEHGVELLARLAEDGPEAATVTVTGRLPQLDRAGDDGPSETYRFIRRPRVHVPGVELVADAELSARDDPYLLDHRIDGVLVLPAVCVLEAMAEAAAVLTGRPAAGVVDGRFDRPVIIPDDGSRTVRICALVRDDGDVDVVVRSDETGFAADHFAGTVTFDGGEPPDVPFSRSRLPDHEGADLYGPVFFHGPWFRRLRRFEQLEATACTAVLGGGHGGDGPFGEDLPATLRLGDPARNDASIHVLQACVPHRRLLPVGCDRFTVHGEPSAAGDLTLGAVERAHTGSDYTWDVVLRDGAGAPVVSWSGLRLRDVGPLPAASGRPAVVAGPYLRRNLEALAWGRDLRLELTLGEDPVVRAAGGEPAACAWVPDIMGVPDTQWASIARELAHLTGEPDAQVRTRLRTVLACLGADAPLSVDGVYEDGWVRLRTGADAVVSAVLSVAGRPRPVAIAVLVKEAW